MNSASSSPFAIKSAHLDMSLLILSNCSFIGVLDNVNIIDRYYECILDVWIKLFPNSSLPVSSTTHSPTIYYYTTWLYPSNMSYTYYRYRAKARRRKLNIV